VICLSLLCILLRDHEWELHSLCGLDNHGPGLGLDLDRPGLSGLGLEPGDLGLGLGLG
jgi:hypothetical protein